MIKQLARFIAFVAREDLCDPRRDGLVLGRERLDIGGEVLVREQGGQDVHCRFAGHLIIQQLQDQRDHAVPVGDQAIFGLGKSSRLKAICLLQHFQVLGDNQASHDFHCCEAPVTRVTLWSYGRTYRGPYLGSHPWTCR
jgi:hypothetical protein